MLLENKSVDFVFALDDTLSLSNKYFLSLYKSINPSFVTYGKKFGFKDEMEERQKLLKNCKFSRIKHPYDNVQTTTNIIEEITKRYSI